MSPFRFCLPLVLLVSLFSSASAQETEQALRYNPELIRKAKFHPRSSAEARSGGGSLTLPFFDDFSRYSLPTDDPEIPQSWQRWSDTMVYINSTLPVSARTIGVATLDGLNGHGYPYDFTDEYAWGPADTLTSLPIDLSSYSAEDNVYLSFFYQGGGLGNSPDEDDSLVVDFYSPFGPGQWFRVWGVPGTPDVANQEIFIHINLPEYLLDGFRFRFRNYATISGAFDQWHIDYVQVRENVDPANAPFDEVAMQRPIPTLLSAYTAMPWTHFISDPESFMADSFTAYEINLGPTENIVTGYNVTYDGNTTNFFDQNINPNNNGFQELSPVINLNGFTYDPEVNDTCATFTVCSFINPTDAQLQNDTTCFDQVFANYYAYDDGSAERAWSVEAAGASVAVKYRAEVTDSLLGVFIHWIPYGDDVSLQTFLLRVWNDGGGEPGSMYEQFNFNNPRYYDDGYNVFTYYPLDQPIELSGNFYIGWTQPSSTGLPVGNDKNTNTNTTKLFYNLGLNQPWQQSGIEGSVMVRPVFKSGKSWVWNHVDDLAASSLRVFPNPADDQLNVDLPYRSQCTIQIFDQTGRLVQHEIRVLDGLSTIDVSSLEPAVYVLLIRDEEGNAYRHTVVIR